MDHAVDQSDMLIGEVKETGAKLIYQSDPATLIDQLLKAYCDSHHRRALHFC